MTRNRERSTLVRAMYFFKFYTVSQTIIFHVVYQFHVPGIAVVFLELFTFFLYSLVKIQKPKIPPYRGKRG